MEQIFGTISIDNAVINMPYGGGPCQIHGNVVLSRNISASVSKEGIIQWCRENDALTLRIIEDLNAFELVSPVEIAELVRKSRERT